MNKDNCEFVITIDRGEGFQCMTLQEHEVYMKNKEIELAKSTQTGESIILVLIIIATICWLVNKANP